MMLRSPWTGLLLVLAVAVIALWLLGTHERDAAVQRGARHAIEPHVVDKPGVRRTTEPPHREPPNADAREAMAAPDGEPHSAVEKTAEERVVSTASLRGRVVLADGGTPVPGAQVYVTPKGTLPEHGPSQGQPSLGPMLMAWARADSDGRFQLPLGLHGMYAIHASGNRWLVTTTDPIEFVAGQDRELLLVLPPAGSLRGTIRAPVAVGLEELVVVIRPKATPKLAEFLGELHVLVELDGQGTFDSGFFPPGELSIGLKGPAPRLPRGFPPPAWAEMPELDLGVWHLRDGITQPMEIDLRKRWFGSIRARVTGAGRPLAHFVVEARPVDSAQYFETRPPIAHTGRAMTTRWIGARTFEDGTAVLGYATPGEWSVRIMPSEHLPRVPTPEVVRVHAGVEADWAIDVGPVPIESTKETSSPPTPGSGD